MKSKPFAGFWIENNKIIIPPGNKKFSLIDYIGDYPVIWTKVVGVTASIHKKAIQDYVEFLKENNEEDFEHQIILMPEPSNKFDKYAHKINISAEHVHWTIGYVPKEIAKLLTHIKKKFNISYTTKLDRIKSNMINGIEIGFPCSAAVVLTPNTTGPSMPLHRVIKTSAKFKDMKSFKSMLEETSTTSKKRKKAQ